MHGMLGMLSGFPEIWIQLYGVFKMIHFTPSANRLYTFRICETKVYEKCYEASSMYIAC